MSIERTKALLKLLMKDEPGWFRAAKDSMAELERAERLWDDTPVRKRNTVVGAVVVSLLVGIVIGAVLF